MRQSAPLRKRPAEHNRCQDAAIGTGQVMSALKDSAVTGCSATAQAYVLWLEGLSGAQVSVLGVAPGHEQHVIRRNLLA